MGKKTATVLFIGDVVGKPGLQITVHLLKGLVSKHSVDFVICNGENTHNGKGTSREALHQLKEAGVDVITGGNHTWNNFNFFDTLKSDPSVIRPLNYPKGVYGKGYGIFSMGKGLGDLAVVNLQGRTFMSTIDCPFRTADWVVKQLKDKVSCIVVDMHAEATAEKIALGWYLDGRVSAVIGTHTHVQTADERILPKGTGYCSDVGMTGPYESVIGMDIKSATDRFLYQTPHKYLCAEEKDVHFSAVILQIDTETGKTTGIKRIFYPEFNRGEALENEK